MDLISRLKLGENQKSNKNAWTYDETLKLLEAIEK